MIALTTDIKLRGKKSIYLLWHICLKTWSTACPFFLFIPYLWFHVEDRHRFSLQCIWEYCNSLNTWHGYTLKDVVKHKTLAVKTYWQECQCPALLSSACDSVTEIILKKPLIQFMRVCHWSLNYLLPQLAGLKCYHNTEVLSYQVTANVSVPLTQW